MRGAPDKNLRLFYQVNLVDFVPENHPLRDIKTIVDAELQRLAPKLRAAYSDTGRPSIPPQQLLKSLLLKSLYSIRSETLLVEMIRTNFMFRWFIDLPLDEKIFTHDVFSDNRDRLAAHRLEQAFFDGIVANIIERDLISNDHFSVDGTLIQAHASFKSLKLIPVPDESKTPPANPPSGSAPASPATTPPSGFAPASPAATTPSGSAPASPATQSPTPRVSDSSTDGDSSNPTINFHGEKRGNATHRSLTDPEARLFRKGAGKPALLCHMGHGLMENRHGFLLALSVSEANGTAERDEALELLDSVRKRHWLRPKTLGADMNYTSGEFLLEVEARKIVPHSAGKSGTIKLDHSDPELIAGAEARKRLRDRAGEEGYELSQRCRKKIEEVFGWVKTVAGLARTALNGRVKLLHQTLIAGAAYNVLRLVNLVSGKPKRSLAAPVGV